MRASHRSPLKPQRVTATCNNRRRALTSNHGWCRMHTHDSHRRHSTAQRTSSSNGGTQVWGRSHTYPHYSPHPRRCDGRAGPMGHVNGALVCGGVHTYSHFPTISVGHVTGVGVWSYLLTLIPQFIITLPPTHYVCVQPYVR